MGWLARIREDIQVARDRDPAARHAELVARIERANRLYYVEDAPELTDAEYDAMVQAGQIGDTYHMVTEYRARKKAEQEAAKGS